MWSAVWSVRQAAGGGFTLTAGDGDRALAIRSGGELATAAPAAAARFEFEPATACRPFPEIETSTTGKPKRGRTPYGEVRGFWDPHMHIMAFEAFGGGFHCGRPWHPLGVGEALPDCAKTEGPQGVAAPAENYLNWGDPVHPHDTVGWPTFNDWPNHHSLTYEQTYYKWLERTWLGGMRIVVNLLFDNRAFCELVAQAQHRRNPCDEMNTVRLQAKAIYEMQDYIDAQAGGPGKGFFRIVRNPFQARKVINKGKLAVVLGIESSELFGCTLNQEVPECDQADVDRGLDEVHDLGVRDLELLNKFDNAFAGVRFDGGTFGAFVNLGQQYTTGRFWDARTCTGSEHDNTIITNVPASDPIFDTPLDEVVDFANLPTYPSPPHCNVLGLMPLGEYLVRRMMEKRMIIDPDHMSALGVDRALAVVDEADYSGVVSSHSWMDRENWPDIYDLGGVVGPAAGGGSETSIEAWEQVRGARNRKHFFGLGIGDDMGGFAGQGAPREGAPNPVRYPFQSFDGSVTLDRQRSGERVFDINVDGVAHFGMYPDLIEDMRMIAGNKIVRDLSRGAEAYLQMWERINGVAPRRCRPANGRLTQGLGRIELGDSAKRVLKRAGQPYRRPGRTYRYCVRGGRKRAKAVAVFTPRGKVGLVATTARKQIRRTGDGPRFEIGKGFAAVARPGIAGSDAKLRRYLRLARVR